MLSIRDEDVRTLAEAVKVASGALNLTAAIKLALQNELIRARESIPLREAARTMRADARAKAIRPAGSDAHDWRG